MRRNSPDHNKQKKKMEEKEPITTKANGAQKTTAVCAVLLLIIALVDLVAKLGAVAFLAEKAKEFAAPFKSMFNLGSNNQAGE